MFYKTILIVITIMLSGCATTTVKVPTKILHAKTTVIGEHKEIDLPFISVSNGAVIAGYMIYANNNTTAFTININTKNGSFLEKYPVKNCSGDNIILKPKMKKTSLGIVEKTIVINNKKACVFIPKNDYDRIFK